MAMENQLMDISLRLELPERSWNIPRTNYAAGSKAINGLEFPRIIRALLRPSYRSSNQVEGAPYS